MSNRLPQIVAIGGGGFDSDAPCLELDRYILSLTAVARPKICFIPTACGDSVFRVQRFLRAALVQDCQPGLLELFRPPTLDLADYVQEFDAVFVGGGNTRNMLVLWKEWGLDRALLQAWQSGVVMAGVSAGANCWFDACSTDSLPGELTAMPCLGWLPGAFCPHYDTEPNRAPSLARMLQCGDLPKTLAVGHRTAVRFEGTNLAEAVSDSADGIAKFVSWEEGRLREVPVPIRLLH